ncbi:hypothetical protein ACSBR1_005939 [Camellia fascicularis]
MPPCHPFSPLESLIPVVDESREIQDTGEGMDVCQNGVDCNKELWLIEHPVEPPDEDQPVKCPMPHTSLVNERFSDSMRKRTDISAVMNEEGMMVVAAEPPARAVHKRHHTKYSRGSSYINSFIENATISSFSNP